MQQIQSVQKQGWTSNSCRPYDTPSKRRMRPDAWDSNLVKGLVHSNWMWATNLVNMMKWRQWFSSLLCSLFWFWTCHPNLLSPSHPHVFFFSSMSTTKLALCWHWRQILLCPHPRPEHPVKKKLWNAPGGEGPFHWFKGFFRKKDF